MNSTATPSPTFILITPNYTSPTFSPTPFNTTVVYVFMESHLFVDILLMIFISTFIYLCTRHFCCNSKTAPVIPEFDPIGSIPVREEREREKASEMVSV